MVIVLMQRCRCCLLFEGRPAGRECAGGVGARPRWRGGLARGAATSNSRKGCTVISNALLRSGSDMRLVEQKKQMASARRQQMLQELGFKQV